VHVMIVISQVESLPKKITSDAVFSPKTNGGAGRGGLAGGAVLGHLVRFVRSILLRSFLNARPSSGRRNEKFGDAPMLTLIHLPPLTELGSVIVQMYSITPPYATLYMSHLQCTLQSLQIYSSQESTIQFPLYFSMTSLPITK
jgi:hypothetical protein